MKTLLTSVLAIATFAIMMTSVPSAFAQATPNTHAVDPVPAAGNPGDLFTMQSIAAIDGSAPAGADIYINRVFVLYDPNGDATIPVNPTGASSCENYLPTLPDRLWALRANGVQVEASHDQISAQTSSIFFDSNAVAGQGFGSGSPANPSIVGGASWHFFNPGVDTAEWVEINTAGVPTGNFDTTTQSGDYVLVVCGFVDVDSDGVWDGLGVEPRSVEARSFLIFSVVGGEMMPLSTTSLLVAGASANALWILPILGLAGTIITIRKLEA